MVGFNPTQSLFPVLFCALLSSSPIEKEVYRVGLISVGGGEASRHHICFQRTEYLSEQRNSSKKLASFWAGWYGFCW